MRENKMPLTMRIISDNLSFESIRDQWSKLLAENNFKSAFFTWEWLFIWWNEYGKSKRLWIITVWEDKNLIGIAPMMIETNRMLGLSLKLLTNIGVPHCDVGGFLYSPSRHEVPRAIIEFILKNRKEWDIVELNEFITESPEAIAVIQSALKGVSTYEARNDHWHIILNETWEQYSKKLSKKFRYNLRRAQRLAEEIGRVEVRKFPNEIHPRNLLADLIDVNCRSNYPKICNSIMEQNLLGNLIEASASNKNFLTAFVLYIDGKPMAYEYGFVHERKFESWRAGYDTSLPQNISIGKLLAMEVIQKCINDNILIIDFLRGDEAYKLEWKPEVSRFSNIRVFNMNNFPALSTYLWLQWIKPFLGRFIPRYKTQ